MFERFQFWIFSLIMLSFFVAAAANIVSYKITDEKYYGFYGHSGWTKMVQNKQIIFESDGAFKVSAQYIESENLDSYIDLSIEIPGKNYSAMIPAEGPVIYINEQHIEEESWED